MNFVYELYGYTYAVCNGSVSRCYQIELGSTYLLWIRVYSDNEKVILISYKQGN